MFFPEAGSQVSNLCGRRHFHEDAEFPQEFSQRILQR